MRKAELIGMISSAANISMTDAMKSLDTMLEAITVTLKKGDKVMLVDFGTFYVTTRKARVMRKVKAPDRAAISGKRIARFTSGISW